MPRINARAKGAAGERELAKWLHTTFNLGALPTRNLEQVRSGGSDIIDFYPFYFECKRVESLDLQSWWNQVLFEVRKCMHSDPVPVVAFRQNRKPWEFLISASEIGLTKGFIRLRDKEFIGYAEKVMASRTIRLD